MNTKSHDQVRILHAWVEAFNARDVEAILDLYADHATHRTPKSPTPHVGKEALRAWWTAALERAPGLHYAVRRIITEGEVAILAYVRSAPGQPSLEVLQWFEFDGPHIVLSRVFHG